MPTALTSAQGTAVRALDASSLMCTEASKPPAGDMSVSSMQENEGRGRTNCPQRSEEAEHEGETVRPSVD